MCWIKLPELFLFMVSYRTGEMLPLRHGPFEGKQHKAA